MKRYILLTLACSLLFASCEKDSLLIEQPQEYNKGGFVNPEDIANLVIPEGKALLVFPFNTLHTRAELNPHEGESSRISRLRYLVYKENGGAFTLVSENNNLSIPQSWPYNNDQVLTHLVDEGGTYRVVFLGNVDASLFDGEEVLTGVEIGSSYENARINLPSIEKFGSNETKLFHWAKSKDLIVAENGSVSDNIVLQRIVTKSSLTTYGIAEGITVSGEDYPSKFYASLLDQNHSLGFYNNVFGKGSQFEKTLQEMLERDIIFPLASCLDYANMLDSNKEYVSWYDGLDKDEYLLNYVVSSAGGKSQYTQNAYSSLEEVKEALKVLKEKNRLNENDRTVINDYLEKLYKGEYAQKLIEGIIADDFLNDDNKQSVTATKQAIIEALKKEQNSNGAVFPTWSYLSNMNVQLSGNYPSAVNFDLEVVGESKTFTEPSTVALSPSTETTDKTLNIYLLGSMDESKNYTFALQSLSGDGIIFTTNGISEQKLCPNTWTNYRLAPSNIRLGEMLSDKICKVIVSYHHLTTQIELNIQSKCIKYPLMFSNNLGKLIQWAADEKWWNFGSGTSDVSRATGRILTDFKDQQDKVGIFFQIPDLSSKNLTGTLNWSAEMR